MKHANHHVCLMCWERYTVTVYRMARGPLYVHKLRTYVSGAMKQLIQDKCSIKHMHVMVWGGKEYTRTQHLLYIMYAQYIMFRP